jgi:hypothetical protein
VGETGDMSHKIYMAIQETYEIILIKLFPFPHSDAAIPLLYFKNFLAGLGVALRD